jgi:hypothetical protein
VFTLQKVRRKPNFTQVGTDCTVDQVHGGPVEIQNTTNLNRNDGRITDTQSVLSSSNSLPPASSHYSLSPTRNFWCSVGKFYYFIFYLFKNCVIMKFRKSSIVCYFLTVTLNVEAFFPLKHYCFLPESTKSLPRRR